MKVIGVGYPKTGTKTLGECFRILGLRTVSWDVAFFEAYQAGEIDNLIEIARGYQSFEDLPWCLIFRELDQAFPGSKFILTVRESEKSWFDSERIHRATYVPDEWMLRSSQSFQDAVSNYRAHNREVREYFGGRRDDLLEVCWERGDGWRKLCEFLEVPFQDCPIPHKNRKSRNALSQLYIRYLGRLQAEPTTSMRLLESVMGEVIEDMAEMSLAEVTSIRDTLGREPETERWRRIIDKEIRSRR